MMACSVEHQTGQKDNIRLLSWTVAASQGEALDAVEQQQLASERAGSDASVARSYRHRARLQRRS